MSVLYLFSSPQGDRPVSEEELASPLRVCFTETHPVLTLRDYFDSIRNLLLKDDAIILTHVISEGLGRNMSPGIPFQLEIRCEKVGTLYHVASITFLSEAGSLKFAVATAIGEEAIQCMEKEILLLRFLAGAYHLTCLPRIFHKAESLFPSAQGNFILSHAIQEWFEDYHEWHLQKAGNGQQLMIWDQKRGYRPASDREYFEIFWRIAKILTLCYDMDSFRQVYPWHHAGGDFIVKSQGLDVDVKLTTVRGHEPILVFLEKEEVDLWRGLIFFFLNLTIKMRLDRDQGVGEVMWAEEPCLSATVQGFVDALGVMEAGGRLHLGKTGDIITLLKSFSAEEMRSVMDPLLSFYSQKEKEDYPVIIAHLEDHVRELLGIIQFLPA